VVFIHPSLPSGLQMKQPRRRSWKGVGRDFSCLSQGQLCVPWGPESWFFDFYVFLRYSGIFLAICSFCLRIWVLDLLPTCERIYLTADSLGISVLTDGQNIK
jgi:hypothetical protein